jgi:ATP synthase protein I
MTKRSDESAIWTILGYLLSGLLFWGGVGYFADRFFNTSYLTLVGVLMGMGGGLYLVWLRFGR